MSHIDEIAVTAITRYRKRAKDESFRRFVRQFPCVACKKVGTFRRPIEAAHMGPRAFGSKADDCLCLPLCSECHQHGPGALHKVGPVEFQAVHSLDFAALQGMFNTFYFHKFGKWAKGWEVEEERRKAA